MTLSRRTFIRQMMALGFSAAAANALFGLTGCAPAPAPTDQPDPTAVAPTAVAPTTVVPTAIEPTATAQPTSAAAASTATDAPPSPTAIRQVATPQGEAYLSVVRNGAPTEMVQRAIAALGGIERFVKPGDDVIVKPNLCTTVRDYEYAAFTNPEVIGAIVALCVGAGAKRVRVMDYPFGPQGNKAYQQSGVADAVAAAGGETEVMVAPKFQEIAIPNGVDLKSWPVYADVVNADVFIDVPIAKDHELAKLTLGMKNLMGVIQNRNQMHRNLAQRIADITSLVRPTLTVVDAVRILMDHGPTGGNLDDVKQANTIIASPDIIAADAYAATLFGLTGDQIPATAAGAAMGLGTLDLDNIRIQEINL